MTPTQFQTYLKNSSGRAILGLRAEADKEPFVDIFLDHIKGHSSCALDVYDVDLLNCFPRRDAMAADIFAYFEPLIKQGEASWTLSFLARIGYRDAVTDIVNTRYHGCHKNLMDALAAGKEIRKCPESTAYFRAADNFTFWMEPPEPHARRVLLDMAELCAYSDDPFPPFDFPVHHIVHRLRWTGFRRLMEEIRHEHPQGPRLWEEIDKRIYFSDAAPDPNITAAEILASREHDRENLRLYLSFLVASPDVVREVAEGILKETDPRVRSHLMMFFCKRYFHGKRHDPPTYPLDPVDLIKLAESERESMSETTAKHTPPARTAYLLCSIRHPAVRAYGESLLADPKSSPFLRHVGMWMTYGANYKSEDGEKLLFYIKNYPEPGDCWDAINILIENGERGIPDLPLEALVDIAETEQYLRHSIVCLLDKAGLLTADQREALAYDRNTETRARFGTAR